VVAEIDPGLADTATLTEAFGLELELSCNCVLVTGRRAGEERLAGVVVRATTRADVNTVVRRLLDVRKATFLPVERATAETGMEYGGITPLGLPEGFRVLIDARVRDGGPALLGSGLRRSKLLVPGELLARAPGVETVEGLALAGPASAQAGRPEGDRGGRRDVERVALAGHRDAHDEVARLDRGRREPCPFRAEHERKPLGRVGLERLERDRIVVEREGCERQTRRANGLESCGPGLGTRPGDREDRTHRHAHRA